MERNALKNHLKNMLGTDKVLTEDLDLLYYSYDSSFLTKLQMVAPDTVVLHVQPRMCSKSCSLI